MVQYNKKYPTPKPDVNEDTIEYWRLLQETKQLHVQKCKNCGTYSHPPRPVCHNCRQFTLELVPTAGKGTVYSYVVYHRSVHPGFEVPYDVILVELEEGVRIVSNMVDCEPDAIYIGMPVELVIEQVFEDVALPKFKRQNT